MNADERLSALSEDAWQRVLDIVLDPAISFREIRHSLSEDERESLHVALLRWLGEPEDAKELLIAGLESLADDYCMLTPLARKLALLGKRAQSGEEQVRLLTLRRFLGAQRSCAGVSA